MGDNLVMKINKLVLTLAMGLVATSSFAADYKIDPAHSFVTFRIQHLGFSWTHGQFNSISGEFSYDSASPEARKISVQVDPASVDTNHAERDKDVRENYLHVADYAVASFESSKYTGTDEEGVLEGTLTIHGVSKPIAIDVKKIGEGEDPWGNYRAGFSGQVSFSRPDWGVTNDLGPKGDIIEFELTIEGIRM